MQSVIDRYLSVNPRRLNPFNQPHHDFVPSGDTDADADYLALVAAGTTSRFYVTLTECPRPAGRYDVAIFDGYNGNLLLTKAVKRKHVLLAQESPLFAALRLAIEIAARLEIDFRPELMIALSWQGQQDSLALERYAAGTDADDATDWVSWTTQPETAVR